MERTEPLEGMRCRTRWDREFEEIAKALGEDQSRDQIPFSNVVLHLESPRADFSYQFKKIHDKGNFLFVDTEGNIIGEDTRYSNGEFQWTPFHETVNRILGCTDGKDFSSSIRLGYQPLLIGKIRVADRIVESAGDWHWENRSELLPRVKGYRSFTPEDEEIARRLREENEK